MRTFDAMYSSVSCSRSQSQSRKLREPARLIMAVVGLLEAVYWSVSRTRCSLRHSLRSLLLFVCCRSVLSCARARTWPKSRELAVWLSHGNRPTFKLYARMSEPQHVAQGKVREIYSTSDPSTLLFVASDRVSAFDVIMKNVRGNPGAGVYTS